MVHVGLLTADIDSGVWGTPANFNGFRVLAALMQLRHSPEANQTLHDVRPLPGLIFGGCSPITEFYHMQNSLCVSESCAVLLAKWQRYCTALEQWGRAKHCGVKHRDRAPPIFDRATITMGNGPHCSSICFIPSLISSSRRLYVYHTSSHDVAL